MSVARIEEAFLLAERGETAPAADVLERVIAAAPGYAPAYVLAARLSETLHRWPQALALWQDAALLIPTLDVAHEGVLRATRVIAALQALDARTAARAEPASAPGPAAEEPAAEMLAGDEVADDEPVWPAAPLSPPEAPAAEATSAPEAFTPPPPPEAAREETYAEPPPREETPAIRLGSPSPPPVEQALPPGWRTFGSPPAPPPADPPATHPPADHGPSQKAHSDAEWMPRRPLHGATFDAPPPPPDVFARPDEAPPHDEPEADDVFGGGLDLDALIEQLNTQGRIRPREDADRIPAPDLDDDIEDMVSETLARIYATQGQYDEAARIYELLAAQQPEQAEEFMQKADEMRRAE